MNRVIRMTEQELLKLRFSEIRERNEIKYRERLKLEWAALAAISDGNMDDFWRCINEINQIQYEPYWVSTSYDSGPTLPEWFTPSAQPATVIREKKKWKDATRRRQRG